MKNIGNIAKMMNEYFAAGLISMCLRKVMNTTTVLCLLAAFFCFFTANRLCFAQWNAESRVEKGTPVPLSSGMLSASISLPYTYYSNTTVESTRLGAEGIFDYDGKREDLYPGLEISASDAAGDVTDYAPVIINGARTFTLGINNIDKYLPANWVPENTYNLGTFDCTVTREKRYKYAEKTIYLEVFYISFTIDVTIDKDCKFTLSGNPVDIFTGEKRESATDMSISHGSVNWSFSRNYCNQEFKRSMVGCKWFTNWDKRLFMTDKDGDGIVAPLDASDDNEDTFPTYYGDVDGDLVPDLKDPYYNIIFPSSAVEAAKIPKLFLYPINNYAWVDKGQARSTLGITSSDCDAAKIIISPVDDRCGGTSNLDLSKTIYVYDGIGTGIPYHYNTVTSEYLAPTGRSAKLTADLSNLGDNIVIRYDNGMVETYYGFHNPPQLTDGKLYSIQDASEHSITLSHDAFGRITQFKDDQGKVIASFLYWDVDEFESFDTYKTSEKANLLKTLIDFSGHEIGYDYDDEGNLTSVDDEGRVTKYDYYTEADFDPVTVDGKQFPYFFFNANVQHNLKSVTKPREVASETNTPYKVITYGFDSTQTNYNRVTEEIVGEKDGNGNFICGGIEKFEYYLNDGTIAFPDDNGYTGEDSISRSLYWTHHTKLDEQENVLETTDYYFNFWGQNVRTVRFDADGIKLITDKTVNSEGHTATSTSADGLEGTTTYLDVNEFDYLGLGRLFVDKVAETTQEGCGCSGGSGVSPIVTEYAYDILTGEWRIKTEHAQGATESTVTTRYFDYQEAPFGTTEEQDVVLGALAQSLFVTESPTSEQKDAVLDLLEYLELYDPINPTTDQMGLGDCNGDGATSQFMGNIVMEVLPPVSNENGSQSRVLRTAYYDSGAQRGMVKYNVDAAGAVTYYDYDGCGQLTLRIDDADYATAGYDATRPSELPDAINARWTFAYNQRGLKVSETNPRGVRTDYEYNAWDQLTCETQAAGVNPDHNTQSPDPVDPDAPVLKAFAFKTKYTYDPNGQLTNVEREDRGETAGCGPYVEQKTTYDILGNRTCSESEISNENFAETHFYYDSAGRQVLTVHPQGNADYTEYDSMGRVCKVIRGLTSLGDLAGNIVNAPTLSSTLTGTPSTTEYLYKATEGSGKGKLEYVIQPNGGRIHYTYDDFGRKKTEMLEDNPDTSGVDEGDPLEKTTEWFYDDLGRTSEVVVTGKVNPSASSAVTLSREHYAYDADGRQIQTNRELFVPTGVTTARTITLASGPLTQTGEAGADDVPDTGGPWIATRTVYDAAGRAVQTKNDDGSVVTRTYDGLGRVVLTETSGGDTTRNWYDVAGNVIETLQSGAPTRTGPSALTFRTTMFYDSLNRMVTQVDNAGRATDYRYNSLGQTVAVTDANGPNDTARTFHRRGDVTSAVSVNDLGNVALFTYDGVGRKLSEAQVLTPTGKGNAVDNPDWMSEQPQFANVPPLRYVADTRPDSVQGGGDGLITTQFGYADNGPRTWLIDDNGNKTAWTYDVHGRRLTEKKGIDASDNTGGTTIFWSFNADGTVATQTKEDGTILYYVYDQAGRLSEVRLTNASGTLLRTFQCNALGQVVQSWDTNDPAVSTDGVTATSCYDSLGRLIEESLQIGTGDVRVTSTHYASNHRSSLVYPNERVIEFTFTNGQQRSIKDAGAATNIVDYDYQGGRLEQRAMQNGVNLNVTYNSAGLPETWIHEKNNTDLLNFHYYYDAAGNKVMRVAGHDAQDTQRYAYDSANRLTAFSRGNANVSLGVPDLCTAPDPTWTGATSAQFWELDGTGNWRKTTTKIDTQTPVVEERSVDRFNAYTDQTYDVNGNMTLDNGTNYAWDAFNRLASVSDTGGTIVTYLYDAQGRRVKEDVDASRAWSDVENAYDDWRVIAEYENGAANAKRQFVYGNYIDEHLVMDVNADPSVNTSCYILAGTVDSSDVRYVYCEDALYSVCALTDASGAIAEAYQYDAYGKHTTIDSGTDSDWFNENDVRTEKGESAIGNPFFYTGRDFDFAIGKQNTRKRILDQDRGRFLSKDETGYVDGYNLYQYARSNPMFYSDAMGLQSNDTNKIAIAFLGFTQDGDDLSEPGYKHHWRNLVKKPRADEVFTSRAEGDGLGYIIKHLDTDGDGLISECDDKSDIRIVGYSWGAVTAVHVSMALNELMEEAKIAKSWKKDPKKFEVQKLGLLDPVGSGRFNGRVEDNVISPYEVFQTFGITGPLPNITFEGYQVDGLTAGEFKDVTGEGGNDWTPDHRDLGYYNWGGYAEQIASRLD